MVQLPHLSTLTPLPADRQTVANLRETYTVSQVAEILGISIRSVYRYVEACRVAFPTLTHGENNRLLFRSCDLEGLAKLVNLRKTTGARLEALKERFTTPGQTCQELAEPPTTAVELAKPGNQETGPNLLDLGAQLAELRAELARVQAERSEDRAAMAALLHRLAKLEQPALPPAPAEPRTPRPWRPMALPTPPVKPKSKPMPWWRAFLWPELQRNEG